MKKILLAALVALAACKPADPAELKGKAFQTSGANGTAIALSFDAEQARAAGRGVNRFFAPYEAEADKIKFGPAGSTMMMGLPGAMEDERAFHAFLSKVESWGLKDGRLTLKASDGASMTFEPAQQEPAKEAPPAPPLKK